MSGNKNGSHWIRDEKRQRIYERDKFRCLYCGKYCADRPTRTLDHVVPRERGGGNEATNLATACLPCNREKEGQTLEQYVPDDDRRHLIYDQLQVPLRAAAPAIRTAG